MLTSNSEKRKNGRHTHLPPQQRPQAHRPALKVRGAQAALGASVPTTRDGHPQLPGEPGRTLSRGTGLLSLEQEEVSFSTTLSSSSVLTRENLLESFLLIHSLAFFFLLPTVLHGRTDWELASCVGPCLPPQMRDCGFTVVLCRRS